VISISILLFIQSLTGKVYKILLLKESEIDGCKVYLSDYLDSLLVDMMGAPDNFVSLKENIEYITVLNIVNYMSSHPEITTYKCKREVFKALRLLNKIEVDVGGDNIE